MAAKVTENLVLPLKAIYFDAIRRGEKVEEYRERTPYWIKRLVGRTYTHVILKRGYPKNGDTMRIMTLPWRGYVEKTLTHPHFGDEPVEVFAINVSRALTQSESIKE